MPAPKHDPTFIKDKDRYYIDLCKHIATASSHPIAKGGCLIVRDREIIADGRSIMADCKVEVDCIAYAIATACKRGTPITGATIYSTRYPYSASVFQLYLMGIRKLMVLAHDWEPYYKDEFRRAARLARELSISIEPIYDYEDPRFSTNRQAESEHDEEFNNKDLYVDPPTSTDGISPEKYDEQIHDANYSSL